SGSFAGTELKQVNFMGGLRRTLSAGRRWQPFAQAMVGGAHSTTRFEGSEVLIASRTSWGGALGLGTDYRLSRQWALRGQGDYLLLHSDAGWDADPRLSVGLAYRFSRSRLLPSSSGGAWESPDWRLALSRLQIRGGRAMDRAH